MPAITPMDSGKVIAKTYDDYHAIPMPSRGHAMVMPTMKGVGAIGYNYWGTHPPNE